MLDLSVCIWGKHAARRKSVFFSWNLDFFRASFRRANTGVPSDSTFYLMHTLGVHAGNNGAPRSINIIPNKAAALYPFSVRNSHVSSIF